MTPTDIGSFLGLARYYRGVMESFSSIDASLTKSTYKNIKFLWSNVCEGSIVKLKDMLNYASNFTLSEGTDGFVMYFDASHVGLDCVLMHYGKVVAYASRKINVHERNYLIGYLDLEVVVIILKIWCYYLNGVHVDICSDHKIL